MKIDVILEKFNKNSTIPRKNCIEGVNSAFYGILIEFLHERI